MCVDPGDYSAVVTFGCRITEGGCAERQSSITISYNVPDPTPSGDVTIQQLTPTSIRALMTYGYPVPSDWRALNLDHWLPGATGWYWRWAEPPAGSSGTKQVDFDTTCWAPGPHRFVYTISSCINGKFSKTSEATYNAPADLPILSIATTKLSSGHVRVDTNYAFSPTTPGSHSLELHHYWPDGSQDNSGSRSMTTADQSGTWPIEYDSSCWPAGSHQFGVSVVACNRTTSTTQTFQVDRAVNVDLSMQNGSGTKKAVISYDFNGDAGTGRTLSLEFLPDFPATGIVSVIAPMTVDAATANPLMVDVPDFGTNGVLRVRVSNSCGESMSKDAHIDCDCHPNEGPKSLPNPVRLWDGSMTYTERDPLPADGLPLFVRSYDTLNAADGLFGVGWHSAFESGLVHFMDGTTDSVTIRTEGNRRSTFVKIGASWAQSWPTGTGAAATLTFDGSGWRYRDASSTLVRIYRADGRFAGFEDLSSATTVSIDYDSAGRPMRAYSSDGTWSCTITVAGSHIIAIAVDGHPDLAWQYAYSGSQLQSVSLAGGSPAWRTYSYTSGLLSSVTDATGALIESHTYDGQGRATTSVGGSGTDITSIVYGLPGSMPDSTITQASYATGEVRTFEQRYVQGRQQTIATTGGCGSCGSRNETYAVDPTTGRVMRIQDARGYVSSFSYDADGRLIREQQYDRPVNCDPDADTAHCRAPVAVLLTMPLESTTASTYVTYTYGDPLWPDKPTAITRPSVVRANDTRDETIAYDVVTGTPLTRTASGWTLDASGQTLRVDQTTTVTLYDGTTPAAFDPGRGFSSSWLALPQPATKRKSIDGPRTDVSDVTTFVYYPIDSSVPAANRGRLAAVRNALGHVTTYDNYDVFGNAGRVTDPNGVVTDLTFDALGRIATTTFRAYCLPGSDPACNTDEVRTNSYASATGPLAARIDANGNFTRFEYDGRRRLTAMSRGSSAISLSERMETSYDQASGRKSSDRYLWWNNDPANPGISDWQETRRESYAYDTLAQLTAQTHADGTSIGFTYDDAGTMTSLRDENHTTANTRYVYDPARRPTAVKQTLGTAEITTSYAYDAAGDLVSVTDPNGNVTTYAYDDFGRMLSQTSPVTGTTSYAYDLAGNLISTVDANHATTTTTYDALNRATSTVSTLSGSATETITRTYDNAPLGLGRLASMTDPAGTTTYGYERHGLLSVETRTSGSATMTTSYSYDSNRNRTTLVYPSGLTLHYAYDFANRPVSLTWGGLTAVAGARYLPFGPELSVSFGNGTMQTRVYDSRYRILRNTLSASSGIPIADYTYTEDPVGNITSIHDAIDPSYNRDFGYDDLNRLTVANSGTSLWGPGSYTYDAMGNPVARDLGGIVEVDPNDPLLVRGRRLPARTEALPAPGSIHETYGYAGTTSKLITVTSGGLDHPLVYDAAGNETHYFDDRTYSARNLMSSISEPSEDGKPHMVNYGYDGRGVRLTRSEGTFGYAAPFATRHYVYSPELQLLAISADDNPNIWGKTAISHGVPPMKHEIAWFGGRPVGELVSGSSVRLTFTDHLGTPILQTDDSGAVVWRAEYEPYGDVFALRSGTSAADQPLRFPGQEYERRWEGAEERYNSHRWYGTGLGRYTQADPLSLEGGLNLYRYAIDNPLSFGDPSGLVTVTKAITAERVYTLQDLDSRCHMTNGGVTGGGCTPRFIALGFCNCRCDGARQFQPETEIRVSATQVGYSGPWPLLRHSRVPYAGVRSFETAIQHENELHLDLALAKVVDEVLEMEQPQITMTACQRRCDDISVFVNSEFARRMRQTQAIEESGGDPRNGLP